MSTNIRVIGDRIAVKPAPPVTTTVGGIHLPDVAQRRDYQRGTVVAVGNGYLLASGQRGPVSLSVGDVVLYAERSGVELDEGEKLVVLRENEVLAVVAGERP